MTEKRRFCNSKTLSETGMDYVTGSLDVHSPYGKAVLKSFRPFLPGEESDLDKELDVLEEMISFVNKNPKKAGEITELLCLFKDIQGSVGRSKENTLSVIEIFEVKAFLLNCEKLSGIINSENINKASQDGKDILNELIPLPVDSILNVLDPRGDRMNTFYIYDDFSEKLAELRINKKELEKKIRKNQKELSDVIKKEYGINLTPKFDIVIPKSSEILEKAKAVDMLEQTGEDYSSATFILKPDDETYALIKETEDINGKIEEEEEICCKRLSREIYEHSDLIYENGRRIGKLDFVLAKAYLSVKRNLIRPQILSEHMINIEEGRHLQVEEILESFGKTYCPISMRLKEGVSSITGANMGGKTISLKLAGMISMMAQYGYFVPCKNAEIGLSNFVQILIGDSQSVERGLSSFGSEMEELKEILDRATDRSLILIDEIASGTNPKEGMALTESLIDYLKDKPYITLVTTHFDTSDKDIVNMQVVGLENADFKKLNSELRGAGRRERIDIIGKYMDYRLRPIDGTGEVPKDAINIASMLGVPDEVIKGARKYLQDNE